MIMEAVKSKICRVNWQLETQKEPMLKFKSKGHLLQNSLLLRESPSCVYSALQLIG